MMSSQQDENKEDILNSYAAIRVQIAALEAKKKELEPAAIQAALDIFAANSEKKGGKNVYQNDYGKIQLQFRTKKPNPDEHADLQTLDELIQLESEKAERENAQQIEEVRYSIAELEDILAKLTQTEKGSILAREREKLIERLTSKVPAISFFHS